MEKMNKNAEFVFFSKWLKSPLSVASVTPSSTQLAKAMASGLPDNEGLVIELGGGTGPITHALLEAGVRPDHLVVIERDPHFHRYLQQRFPGINVVCGDALDVVNGEPVCQNADACRGIGTATLVDECGHAKTITETINVSHRRERALYPIQLQPEFAS
jgi:phospholipid N-methyltransferase